MTRPRISKDREIYGIIGKVPNASKIQAEWNAYFKEKGIDAFMDRYPTTLETLPERLSEMFHFDRRMYIVGPELEKEVSTHLDKVEEGSGKFLIILNEGGVLKGISSEVVSPESLLTER